MDINRNVDLASAPSVKCEECDNETFIPVVMFRKISKFMSGSDKDQVVPIETFQCSKCGNIPEIFKPKTK